MTSVREIRAEAEAYHTHCEVVGGCDAFSAEKVTVEVEVGSWSLSVLQLMSVSARTLSDQSFFPRPNGGK